MIPMSPSTSPEAGPTPFSQTQEGLVQTAFLGILGREAAPSELAFWTMQIDMLPDGFLIDVLLASDEFATSYAAEDPETFLRALEFNLFDKNISQPEVDAVLDGVDEDAFDRADFFEDYLADAGQSDVEAFDAKLAIADYVTMARATGGYVPETLTQPDFTGNAELWLELMMLDMEYDTLELDQVATSLEGRPLYAATLGEGETDLLIITQQHGDELTGTEGALTFLDWLAGDSDAAEAVRDELTVTVLPRVNPDGYARLEREIGGERGVLDPRLNEAGLDLNRSYDPDDPINFNDAPEAEAVLDLVEALDPALVLDYHNQFLYRDEDDGTLDTMSLLWPLNAGVAEDVRDTAKQAVAVIDDTLDEFVFSDVTLFPGGDNPAIARNGLALRGAPTILVEQRSLEETFEFTIGLEQDYSALFSALNLEAFLSMKGVAEALADGSLAATDPELALAIPDRTTPIDYDDLYTDDEYGPMGEMMVV